MEIGEGFNPFEIPAEEFNKIRSGKLIPPDIDFSKVQTHNSQMPSLSPRKKG